MSDIPFPKGPYSVIYADPAWDYRVWSKPMDGGRTAESHYPTMKLKDIKALPVQSIAADDCALFMWATYPNLREAFEVLDAWGFTYKTVAFTWAKRTKASGWYTGPNDGWFMGLGYWTRANPEICLLATRGQPKRVSKRVRNLVVSPIGRHSEKPAEVRDRIVELMGDVPRIELFARKRAPGFDCWGNDDALREEEE